MQGSCFKSAIIGFVAAAIAVITVHQAIVYGVTNLGLLPASTVAWTMKPYGPLNVPTIVNGMFWGGLWGALYGVIHNRLPGSALWLKGLIYGLLITLVSNFTLLPLIRKAFGVTNPALTAMFAGGDPKRMLAVALILSGFGATLGVLYGLFNKKA